jgi:hypothetical protein
MEYHEREQLKDQGWSEAHESELPIEKRARGLLKVIKAHFERSLEAWVAARRYRQRPHGEWREYVASWLSANGDRNDGPFATLGPVIHYLRQIFPPPSSPKIKPGDSYWT